MMTPNDNNVRTKQKFHFPGEYPVPPMNIEAETQEEAVKLYQEQFIKKENQPAPQSTGDAVTEAE